MPPKKTVLTKTFRPDDTASTARRFLLSASLVATYGTTSCETTVLSIQGDSTGMPYRAAGEVPTIARHKCRSPEDWLRLNSPALGRYAGKWVAIASSGVVSAADHLPELRAKTDRKGFARTDVVVFKIPASSTRKAVATKKR